MADSNQSSGNSAPADKEKLGFIANAAAQFNNIVKEGAPLALGFNKLSGGVEGTRTALNLFQGGLDKVSPALAKMAGGLGDAVLKQKENMDKASEQLGIGSNNIGKFVRMAGEAGVTTEQFTNIIKNSSNGMAGLGSNAQRSAEIFSKVSKEVLESDVGKQMQEIGVSSEELAKVTALQLNNGFKNRIQTEADQKALAVSAQMLAKEIDATSKVTGQSREAIMNTIKAEEDRPESIVEMINMSKEEADQYERTLQKMGGMGAGLENLTTELVSGGVRTEKASAQMTVLGTAGTQYEAAVNQMQQARTGAEKKAAEEALEVAKAKINERMASQEYRDFIRNGTAEQQAAAKELIKENTGLKASVTAAREANGDFVQGAKNQALQAKNMQEGKTDKGQVDDGAKTAQDLNKINIQATLAAGGMAKEFENVNKNLAKSPEFINAFNKALDYAGRNATMADAQKKIHDAPANIYKAGKSALTGGEATERPVAGANPTGVSETGDVVKRPTHGDGGIIKGPELAVISEKEPEAVIPLSQMKEVVGNLTSTVSSATGASPKGAGGDEEALIAKAQAALKIIKEHGEGSFDTQIKITASGHLRLREQFDADNDRMQSLGDESSRERIAELVKQAEALTAKDKEVSVKRVEAEKINVVDQTTKIAKVKSDSVDDLIKKDMANVQNTAKAVTAPMTSMLGDMFNPKIINTNPKDFKEAPKTSESVPKKAEEDHKKEAEAKAKADAEHKEKAKAADTNKAPASATAKDATMNDLKDQLVLLNKHMTQLITHSETTADASSKAARANHGSRT